MISLAKPHYTNQGIKETRALTVKVVMDCTVDDIYETEGFDNFICKIDGVYAEESVLNAAGKIDYHTLKPVLFEMPTYEYLRTGDVIGKCMNISK